MVLLAYFNENMDLSVYFLNYGNLLQLKLWPNLRSFLRKMIFT